jgi:hypothetical protein
MCAGCSGDARSMPVPSDPAERMSGRCSCAYIAGPASNVNRRAVNQVH